MTEEGAELPEAKDFSQIRSKGIIQIDSNTFTIKGSKCFLYFPIIFFVVGVPFVIIGFFITYKFIKVIFLIIGIVFTLVSICFSFGFYHTILFVIGFNDLTIEEKALLRRKVTVFNRGEIKQVNFTFDQGHDEEGTLMNNYKILITTKEGDEEIYNTSTSWESFTIEEIEFFNNYINNHIKKNMS